MSLSTLREERYKMQHNYYIIMVKHWFDNVVKLPQYYQVFIDEGFVDLHSIQEITIDDLVVMDIHDTLHQKIILKHVDKLKAAGAKYRKPKELLSSIPRISPMMSIACNPRTESPAVHNMNATHRQINWSVLDLATRQTQETRQWKHSQPLIDKMMHELRHEMELLNERAITEQSQQSLTNYRSAVETGIAVTNASVALSVMKAECPDFMASRSYRVALNMLLSSLQNIARNAVDTASFNQSVVLHGLKKQKAIEKNVEMEVGEREQEIDRVEKSKLDLIVNLSLEMEKMREIIKQQQIQLNKNKQ
eukprot:CAMPEP_0197023348 /NCGR_PEP_ID=MMETSP1384-20130603/4056_1 /TAXON_ID=29189 /ORGANISM="Ammonia sp." /LENGTH=305 /DNA_ID=CAMNT_0042451545 /DNA_START=48 /DNA_END=965 /DNA_ORIENTATION=+